MEDFSWEYEVCMKTALPVHHHNVIKYPRSTTKTATVGSLYKMKTTFLTIETVGKRRFQKINHPVQWKESHCG